MLTESHDRASAMAPIKEPHSLNINVPANRVIISGIQSQRKLYSTADMSNEYDSFDYIEKRCAVGMGLLMQFHNGLNPGRGSSPLCSDLHVASAIAWRHRPLQMAGVVSFLACLRL